MLKATLDLIVKEYVDVLMFMKHATESLGVVLANLAILETAVHNVSTVIFLNLKFEETWLLT